MTKKELIFIHTKLESYLEAFSVEDLRFLDNITKKDLDDLVASGDLGYAGHGIYYRYYNSELLGKKVGVGIDSIVKAYSRLRSWSVFPSDNRILNGMGLSTQVPCKHVFNTDGPSCNMVFNNGTSVEFVNLPIEDSKLKLEESFLIVRALKILEEDRITEEVLRKIRNRIPVEKLYGVLMDIRYQPDWIYNKVTEMKDLV